MIASRYDDIREGSCGLSLHQLIQPEDTLLLPSDSEFAASNRTRPSPGAGPGHCLVARHRKPKDARPGMIDKYAYRPHC